MSGWCTSDVASCFPSSEQQQTCSGPPNYIDWAKDVQDGFSHLLISEIQFLIRSLYPMNMVNMARHISLRMPQGAVTKYFIFCSLLLFIYCLQNKNKEICWWHKGGESGKLTGFIQQLYFLESKCKKSCIIFIGCKSEITVVIVFIISLACNYQLGSKPSPSSVPSPTLEPKSILLHFVV